MLLIDADLGDFRQVNIAGVDVDAKVGAFQITDDLCGQILIHIPIKPSGENTVHVKVKSRDSSGDRVNTEWI